MKVVVVHADNLAEAVEFFSNFGLEFKAETHGSGPLHFACQRDEFVFELYPVSKSRPAGLRVIE